MEIHINQIADLTFAEEPDGSFWVEILRTGNWTDMHGKKIAVTGDMLAGIEQAFTDTYPVAKPVIRLGHHTLDKPITGLISAVKRSGETLLGRFDNLAEQVKAKLKAKYYNAVSAGLRPLKLGEKTWPFALDHVAILDPNVKPAVKGLQPVWANLSAEDGGAVLVFATEEREDMDELKELRKEVADLSAKLAQLETEKTELAAGKDDATKQVEKLTGEKTELEKKLADLAEKEAKSEVAAIVEKAAAEGRLLAANKDAQVEIGLQLRGATNFAEDTSAYAKWRKGLEEGAKVVKFGDQARTGQPDENADGDESDFDKEFKEGTKLAAQGEKAAKGDFDDDSDDK